MALKPGDLVTVQSFGASEPECLSVHRKTAWNIWNSARRMDNTDRVYSSVPLCAGGGAVGGGAAAAVLRRKATVGATATA